MLMDFILPSATYNERRIRVVLISLLPIMLIVAIIMHSQYTVGNIERHSLIFLAAVAEIITLVIYLLFLATFIPSFSSLRITVTFKMTEERMRALARSNPDTITQDEKKAVAME